MQRIEARKFWKELQAQINIATELPTPAWISGEIAKGYLCRGIVVLALNVRQFADEHALAIDTVYDLLDKAEQYNVVGRLRDTGKRFRLYDVGRIKRYDIFLPINVVLPVML